MPPLETRSLRSTGLGGVRIRSGHWSRHFLHSRHPGQRGTIRSPCPCVTTKLAGESNFFKHLLFCSSLVERQTGSESTAHRRGDSASQCSGKQRMPNFHFSVIDTKCAETYSIPYTGATNRMKLWTISNGSDTHGYTSYLNRSLLHAAPGISNEPVFLLAFRLNEPSDQRQADDAHH